MPSLLQAWALPGALLAITNIAATWYQLIAEHVPDPYLDEVFHVPQAQRFCDSDWSWDPKITTPPGLYFASLMLEPLMDCSTGSLRLLNVGAICVMCLLTYTIMRNLRLRPASSDIVEVGKKNISTEKGDISPEKKTTSAETGGRAARTDDDDPSVIYDAHSALNISLFPPLFFFSGLYYTDVASTLIVLMNYSAFLQRRKGTFSARDDLILVVLGIVALSFRQTNIFWVAVFPAGLTVIDTLRSMVPITASASTETASAILAQSWSKGRIYDPSVAEAGMKDYILAGLTIVLATARAPLRVITSILPFLALLAIFAGFVVWNGGVVLGDKSNHVATIHVPQMLYIWPFIAFFSFPLLLPVLLEPIIRCFPSPRVKSFCQDHLTGQSRLSAPNIASALAFTAVGLASVHINTIVHPFTRADNRHYVFYVFRILLGHWTVKYLAVPVYFICAYASLQALGIGQRNEAKSERDAKQQASPANSHAHQPCQASFIVVWLATTTLSVVSAPLVEPRYFIIPWIIWRLHIPTVSASPLTKVARRNGAYDLRLVLETVWHLAVNVVTGYVFLHRGFAWESEPGKVQRFMY